MATKPAFFCVSPRLAVLLGESYRSAELALKELVDNAWDANAPTVDIKIPETLAKDRQIIISDTGEGMSRDQIESHYLRIARDRLKERGARTGPPFNREVKGRKGVGKFAGIVIAEVMDVETRQKGKLSRFRIDRTALEETSGDIVKIEVDIETTDCDPGESGTTIILSHLAQTINFPTAESLRHALAPDYGREERFAVVVNSTRLDHMQLDGHKASEQLSVPDVPNVRLDVVIGEKRLPKEMQGVVVKVKGKIIGNPRFFGLDQDETVPPRLLKTVSGVLYADELEEEAARSGWTDLNESEKRVQSVFAYAALQLKQQLHAVYRQQMSAANARFVKKYWQRMRELPEYKREFAKRELENIVNRYLGDDDRTESAIEFMLKGLEQDEYWAVINAMINANPSDIVTVAEGLARFGLVDLAMVARGAKARLDALSSMLVMANDMATLEIQMHEVIEANLWVFGSDYAMLSSNKSLQTIIPKALSTLRSTKDGAKRPDLLLLAMFKERHLLIEFKRPAETLDELDKAQAEKYARLLRPFVASTDIIVLGGRRAKDLPQAFENSTIKLLSYTELLSKAESELQWLLKELNRGD